MIIILRFIFSFYTTFIMKWMEYMMILNVKLFTIHPSIPLGSPWTQYLECPSICPLHVIFSHKRGRSQTTTKTTEKIVIII